MKSRRYFHYLCILLLLFAQQAALSHATWHATGQATGDAPAHEHSHDHASGHTGHDSDHQHHHDEPERSSATNLCAFHFAFGQVLGGVHGNCVLPPAADLSAILTAYVFNPRLGSEAVPAISRGPPPHL